jgi:alpha-mannosidase
VKDYTLEKVAKHLVDIHAAVAREIHPILHFKYHPGDLPDGARPDLDDTAWPDFEVGGYWGGYDQIAWFRARLGIPDHLRAQKLMLHFLVGPRDGGGSTAETMLYANGLPLQGIDVWHETAWLPPETFASGAVDLALRAWSSVLRVPPRRHFKLAQLEWIDEPTEAFYYLADTLRQSILLLDPNDLRRVRLTAALNAAFLRLDFTEPKSPAFYASVAAAYAVLSDQVHAWQALDELKPQVTTVGHAHVDLAWLWRWRHSREKAQRTFATVLHLMRQYPEYRYMHSSPALYAALEEDNPALFARVKASIAAGAWEVTGGMWVEADTNLTSGESLVRQFIFGRRYVRAAFGREMSILWLPDVFGYSAALPQIMAKSGVPYFLTTKLSWNQSNRFPHDTFRWRGIDGTEVLAHFVTTPDPDLPFHTYNGRLQPVDVKGLWDQYQQKDLNAELLHLFGWGDGGGGPTVEMLETARCLQNLPGLPRVAMGRAEPYFDRLAERLAGQTLPVWDGELYLELHRGTYTSQAANKLANRRSELLFHRAEWLSALADVLTGEQGYPSAELDRGWRLILFNQFHDILPGSSIPEVYQDSQADYAEVGRLGNAVVAAAAGRIVDSLQTPQPGLVVFNALGWARGGLVTVPAEPPFGPAQRITAAGRPAWLVAVPPVPALGYQFFPVGMAETASPSPLFASERRLENDYYRLDLNQRGQISALYDKRHARAVLAPGALGNQLQAFEDKTLGGDAWDIDLFYQEKLRPVDDLLEAVVEEQGPLRATVRLRWQFHHSTVTQRLRLYAHSPRIDFDTEVDWHEQQIMLKAAFPVALRATHATYDIQFGCLERPNHWNTSWDQARFEVPAHKWADLSEGDYGVALLNDCKYGYDVKDNVLRLTLLRSPIAPDPHADQGLHTFTYSLLPHAGDWRTGGVIPEAYALNDPLAAYAVGPQPHGNLPARFEFVRSSAPNVIVETVKRAESGAGWVIRVYESRQTRSSAAHLEFGLPLRQAWECNLVEEDEHPVSFEGARLTFDIAPFEIKTFRVLF